MWEAKRAAHFLSLNLQNPETSQESWEKHMLEIQQQGSPAKPPSCTEVKSIC